LKQLEAAVEAVAVAAHQVQMEVVVTPGMVEDKLTGGMIHSTRDLIIMGIMRQLVVEEAAEAAAILHIHHARPTLRASRVARTDQAAVVTVHQAEDHHLAMVGMVGERRHREADLQMVMVAMEVASVMAHMKVVDTVIMVDLVPRHIHRAVHRLVDEDGVSNDMIYDIVLMLPNKMVGVAIGLRGRDLVICTCARILYSS